MPRNRLPIWLTAVVAASVLAGAALAAGGCGGEEPTLYSDAAGIAADGTLVEVPAGSDQRFEPGSRVLLQGQASDDAAREQRAWVESSADLAGGTPYGDMARWALTDLHTLLLDRGALLAGATAKWDYVWPRDASFGAAALAAAAHEGDARAVLGFLQRVQAEDGTFEARYHPDGSPVADGRRPQADGTGWALWALDQVAQELPAPERKALMGEFDALLRRSADHLVAEVADGGLGAASSDYWEKRETKVTLETVLARLAGLQAAERCWLAAGDRAAATAAGDAARDYRAVVVERFGESGFQRYPDGGGADAAVALAMPPLVEGLEEEAAGALGEAADSLARPGGGLAPGEKWSDGGLSWTPETAMFALAAAGRGDRETAERWLDWLDAHRTGAGALPEKVTAEGAPASVAPLSWTAALVILTLAELRER
ncbi:MAG: hypothetical protein LBK95_02625 [Bifidobacteriaceae bacterium]|jgi:GH15 family glucan-1,4-alpha-glucosidase|nr:hypothetical protein [Bifidobacteriaceae bacterium]